MTSRQQRILIEEAVSAWRPDDPRGGLRSHPSWHDLDAVGREQVYQQTALQRQLEAGLDEDGLSSTARVVLRRIAGA